MIGHSPKRYKGLVQEYSVYTKIALDDPHKIHCVRGVLARDGYLGGYMMNIKLRHIIRFLENYQGEIIISIASTVLGVLLGVLVYSLILNSRIIDLIVIALISTSIIFMVGLSFNIKRNLTWKIRGMESLITEIYGRPHKPTQYVRRLSHFAIEKQLLAKDLVQQQLPPLIKRCCRENAGLLKIALVIDSGTTLAPVFPKLKYYGYGDALEDISKNIAIYTNSLSGVTAFNQETGLEPYKVEDTALHLLGGTPLEEYRANTGEDTLEALRDLRKEYCPENNCLVIGIITANWLLVTREYNQVFICARGRGHHDFKKEVVKISDKIIIVAPLGKILRLNTPEELNKVLEEEEVSRYDGFKIDSESRENTYMLTSKRKRRDSILFPHSQELIRASQTPDKSQNYILIKKIPTFDPKLPREKQIEMEIPHYYFRPHAYRVFGIQI